MAVLAVSPSPSAAQEDPAADQRVVKLQADYRIEPADGVVEVVEEITVSNVRGSTRSGSTVTSYFWTGHTIWTPADAENVSITVEGEPLEFEVADTIQGVDIISAEYRRNLNFGQTRVIDVSYSLPTYAPGEDGRRINGAFFDLELLVCCNFEEVELTVSMPSSFDVDVPTNLQFEPQAAGARQEYIFTASEEQTGRFTDLILADWYGVDEAGFQTTPLSVGGSTIDIVAPPDDASWSDDTSQLVGDVAMELEELTGFPSPLDGAVFRQGLDTNFDRWGSDGPFDEPIVVPRSYDEVAMAITVAKVWLRDGPFDDIDIERGLAADLGTEALRRANGTETTPTDPGDGGLNDLVSDELAFWVVRQVSDELSYDGVRAMLQMADDNETAYVGEGEPEQTVAIPNDWRRFVDLAEQRLGSDIVADLVAEHIVDDADVVILAARDEAVAAYEDVVDRADGVGPAGIRTAMTNWDFDAATPLLIRADEVLDERERVVALAESKGQDPTVALGDAWASGETVDDFDEVEALIIDRENDINSGSLVRNSLIVLGVVLLLAGAGAGAYVLNRRNKQTSPVTSTQAGSALGNPPAPPPGFGPSASSLPPGAGSPATAPPPPSDADLANFPAPPSGPATLPGSAGQDRPPSNTANDTVVVDGGSLPKPGVRSSDDGAATRDAGEPPS